MLATITGTVLASVPRTTQDGKTYVTVYLLQPGRQEPVQAYYSPLDLLGPEPVQGGSLTADVLAYCDRQGRLAVRLDAVHSGVSVAA